MDTRYFSIVGYSGSGKTYLIEQIVKYLVNKDYKVGVVKSIHHPGFGIDIEGKDTTKYAEAGAELVGFVAPESSGIIYRYPLYEKEIFNLFEDNVDYVILEGFKDVNFVPQVILLKDINDLEVFKNNSTIGIYSREIDVTNNDLYVEYDEIPSLLEKLAYPRIPLLNCRKCGYGSCAEFYQEFLKGNTKIENCVIRAVQDIKLLVNDSIVPLNKFAAGMIKNIMEGMIKPLKISEESIDKIELKIDY